MQCNLVWTGECYQILCRGREIQFGTISRKGQQGDIKGYKGTIDVGAKNGQLEDTKGSLRSQGQLRDRKGNTKRWDAGGY